MNKNIPRDIIGPTRIYLLCKALCDIKVEIV